MLNWDLSDAFKQTKKFMEFESDFTPCTHDNLPIQKIMIQSVVLQGYKSDVSLLSDSTEGVSSEGMCKDDPSL